MSAAVKAVKKVVSGARKVVESVGKAVERTVEVAGAAVESTAKAVNNYVVKPIQNDPITFIATAAGATLGGPWGAMAANTAANKAQGRSWGDSLKSGAQAGVSTWVGQNYGPVEAGAAAAAMSKAQGNSWEDALKAGITEGLTQKASSMLDSRLKANSPTAGALSGATVDLPTTTSGVNLDAPTAFTSGNTGVELSAVPDMPSVKVDTPSVALPDLEAGFRDTDLSKLYNDPLMNRSANSVYTAPAPAMPDTYNYSSPEAGPYKSPYVDVDTAPRSIEDQLMSGDEVAGLKRQQQGSGSEIPIEEGLNNSLAGKDPRMYTGDDTSLNVGHLADAAEGAGGWVWDGAKWVWDHPMYALAGYALAQKYLNQDQPPNPGEQEGKDAMDQNKENNAFNEPLQQLTLNRDQLSPGFARSDNPYESDAYNYAERGGEHQFFSPDVYTPVKYAMGGSVMDQQTTGAFDPSLGALNNQAMPSYYRYGSQPQNFKAGGYAQGGVHDGRSDNIPAMLSQGEYVMDAETVGLLGNGSSDAGALKLDQMRKQLRQQKGKALSKGQFSPNARSPLAYIKQRG